MKITKTIRDEIYLNGNPVKNLIEVKHNPNSKECLSFKAGFDKNNPLHRSLTFDSMDKFHIEYYPEGRINCKNKWECSCFIGVGIPKNISIKNLKILQVSFLNSKKI